MLPDKNVGCHRTGFVKTCFECVTQHRCRLWTHIIGVDPNTGQEVNAYGCADEFRNKLIIETSQQTRQAGAAIESFRNEMVKRNDLMLQLTVNGHELPKLRGPADDR